MLSKFIPIVLLGALSCREKSVSFPPVFRQQQVSTDLNPYPDVRSIPLPAGYARIDAPPGSFTEWLRSTGLKKSRTVFLYDGSPKLNQQAQYAVLNISVGTKDLQQCADAVMRLRAEYLYGKKDFARIYFSDNDNTIYSFEAPFTRDHFDNYLHWYG